MRVMEFGVTELDGESPMLGGERGDFKEEIG